MSEPRVWTILIANDGPLPSVSAVHVDNRHFLPGEKVELVEKSAYDALAAKLEACEREGE